MRVKFKIEAPQAPEQPWMIVIEGANKQWKREMPRRDDGGGGGMLPFPPSDTLATGLATQEPSAVLKAYLSIVGRKAETIVEYGRYLFDALLGEAIWKEILDLAEAA